MNLNKHLVQAYCKSKNIFTFEDYLSEHKDVEIYFKYKDKYHFYFLVDINQPVQTTLAQIREEIYNIYSSHENNLTKYKIHDESKNKNITEEYDKKCDEVYDYILSQKRILEHQAIKEIPTLIVKIPPEIVPIASALVLYTLEKKTGCILYRENSTIHIKLDMNINPFD